MEKLLTIIIPTYNTEQYLSRCIESLILPGWMDKLEILIIIDGSPDNSLKIARQYEALHSQAIKVIDKPNGGHGSTINKGIELATGKYFRVLDSDDWFDKDEFDLYLKQINKIDVDLILSNYSREEIFKKRSVSIHYDHIEYNKIYNSDTFDYQNHIGDKLIILSNTTYKTKLLQENNIRLFEKTFYVDVQYSLFVFPFIQNFIFVNCNVYRYFIGREGQSISKASLIKNYFQHRRVIESCVSYYEKYTDQFSINKEYYFREEILRKVIRQYQIAIYVLPSKLARTEAHLWNQFLQKESPRLYAFSQRELFIRLFRMAGPFSYPLSFISLCIYSVKDRVRSLKSHFKL